MPHIVTSLCLRDGVCADVCPSEAVIAGMPESEWPWYYIDPDSCIDCGACVTECPFEAIFAIQEPGSTGIGQPFPRQASSGSHSTQYHYVEL